MSQFPVIAIVDDDEGIRDALSDLLAVSGFASLAYDGAASFLSEYPARRFDCLITDIRMPGMTGIELIELLHDTGQSLPTVILTSIVDERAHARSAALGAHAWLTKPVTDERLLAALASAIHTQLPHSDFKP
ncbi:response regulator [Novosphingobium sp. ST904]|uniref:response regulator transcription factor n=1 Tax=Novosphingobium sp. ST904 TaxID=1684385 RepID=UPI0006C8C666|nr:response regulator [Novosphingobium sp. ST904]KPH64070.1 chemotaxis protein CheY [Novosphingobium sp. ST904]TCM32440.1 response regulator receiver domain-containing protein [Novosphingobium sp. ST904]